MAPEAITDTKATTAEREAWRDVEGAEGPASAAWSTLANAEDPIARIHAAIGLLSHVGASSRDVGEEELGALADMMREALGETRAAWTGALDILRSASRAERIAAEAERNRPDPEAAEARARRMAHVALEIWRERRADLRQHRTAG